MVRVKLEFNMPEFKCHSCQLEKFDRDNYQWYCTWTDKTIEDNQQGVMEDCPLVRLDCQTWYDIDKYYKDEEE